MFNKWERRDAKELAQRRFVSDNRVSVHVLEKISTDGKAKKLKRGKRLKI